MKKKILITGGAGYIGSMLASKLVNLGYDVTVIDLLKYSSDSLSHLHLFKNFKLIVGDVRNIDDVNKTIDSSIETFGRIDALLNNAAGNFISPTENLSPKAFDTVVDIVLKGTYNYSLQTGKYWIENNIKGLIL